MSSNVTKAPLDGQEAAGARKATESEYPRSVGEGLGVFRGLLLMLFLYLAIGFLGWLGWNAFMRWHTH